MPTIEVILREVNRDLVPLFEERLRALLALQDREWLIEQIVRLTLDAHSLEVMDRKLVQEAKAKERAERISRLVETGLDREVLAAFLERYEPHDRERLVRDGYRLAEAPAKGTDLRGFARLSGPRTSRCGPSPSPLCWRSAWRSTAQRDAFEP